MEDSEKNLEAGGEKKPYPRVKNAILLCLLFIGVQMGAGFVMGIAAGIFGVGQNSAPYAAALLAGNIAAAALVLFAGTRKTGKSFRDAVFLRPVSPGICGAVLVFVAGFVIVLSEIDNLVAMILPMPAMWRALFADALGGPFLISLVSVGIAPGIYEELIFRGLFVSGFGENYSPKKTILVTALLFGLVHLNPWQFVTAFLIGLFAAWIVIRSGSILPCVIMHIFNNSAAVLTARFPRLVPVPGFSGDYSAASLQPWWFDLAGALLALAGFLALRSLFRRRGTCSPSGAGV